MIKTSDKTTELLEKLEDKGIELSVEKDKLSIRCPKGVMTPEIRDQLTIHKAEIMELLAKKEPVSCSSLIDGLSLATIGGLIGGFKPNEESKPPLIDPLLMAKELSVTFRPLPESYNDSAILLFREKLQQKLNDYGVRIVSWEKATKEFQYSFKIPLTKWQYKVTNRIVKAGINAVIDVERKPSIESKIKTSVAELVYSLYSRFVWKNRSVSVSRIAKVIGWAEEGAAKYIEDPSNTQVIVLTELDNEFTDPQLPYKRKIEIGLNTLVRTFSELVIGVSESKISILNMNLSDSIFAYDQLDRFVLNSLIPKIFVPILPLPISRFEVDKYKPDSSYYADKLVNLGKKLAQTGLLPPGSQLSNTIKRKSHRDIVSVIVDGRTGVSYGFVAYLEPPQYVGKLEITADEWNSLDSVAEYSDRQVRINNLGRRYLKTKIDQQWVYKQIPDIWLVSSRSGSNKTNLNKEQDIIRIGLTDKLLLQLPQTIDPNNTDIKPSYDVYVMLAIALATSLYAPDLIENGAPLIHFHGYPAKDWFQKNEYYFGLQNPSVPCGTYESGVLNFLGLQNLALDSSSKVSLVSLVEPDHGTNIIASNEEYLMKRLQQGYQQKQIELGGKYFNSLKE